MMGGKLMKLLGGEVEVLYSKVSYGTGENRSVGGDGGGGQTAGECGESATV